MRNLDNGKQIRYSLLVPHMIERYGFYEGKGTPYRVEPRQVVEVFDFLLLEPGARDFPPAGDEGKSQMLIWGVLGLVVVIVALTGAAWLRLRGNRARNHLAS